MSPLFSVRKSVTLFLILAWGVCSSQPSYAHYLLARILQFETNVQILYEQIVYENQEAVFEKEKSPHVQQMFKAVQGVATDLRKLVNQQPISPLRNDRVSAFYTRSKFLPLWIVDSDPLLKVMMQKLDSLINEPYFLNHLGQPSRDQFVMALQILKESQTEVQDIPARPLNFLVVYSQLEGELRHSSSQPVSEKKAFERPVKESLASLKNRKPRFFKPDVHREGFMSQLTEIELPPMELDLKCERRTPSTEENMVSLQDCIEFQPETELRKLCLGDLSESLQSQPLQKIKFEKKDEDLRKELFDDLWREFEKVLFQDLMRNRCVSNHEKLLNERKMKFFQLRMFFSDDQLKAEIDHVQESGVPVKNGNVQVEPEEMDFDQKRNLVLQQIWSFRKLDFPSFEDLALSKLFLGEQTLDDELLVLMEQSKVGSTSADAAF